MFALQDDIARQIGEQLQLKLGVGEMPAARATIDPAAYDEYLKGRALYRQRKSLPEAVAHLRRAVELAPQFGAGWASLSLALEVFYWSTTDAERAAIGDYNAEMVVATERATALEPRAAMTLHAIGNVARAQARYADAERSYQASIEADPSYPDVREDYAELLMDVGRMADCERESRALLALEPRVELFWWRLASLGLATARSELVDEATAKMREINPASRAGQFGRVQLAIGQGQFDTARAELAAAQRRAPGVLDLDARLFQWALKEPGADDAEARRLIAEQTLRAPYALARGEFDLLVAAYERAEARTARKDFYFVLSDPIGQRWLKDPRAKEILKRYGFVAYWRAKGWPALCRPLGADDFECGAAAAKG